MISPETLRKYSFFGFLKDAEFEDVAMIADEVNFDAGETVFEIDTEAGFVYLLAEGEVDLHYSVVDSVVSDKSKEFYVGIINPGEPFGLSALMEPFRYTATCTTTKYSKAIKVDAKKLLVLAAEKPALGYALMTMIAKTVFERLGVVRMELVAAR
ncbi:MAG: Crp/Fnr family transcriptional regulator [Anaerolineales bacterium]|nr:Crp/Fnr family transcriptional regulator [Anaerolineales bacterium]